MSTTYNKKNTIKCTDISPTDVACHQYLGGFEGVVGREGDVQEEHAPLVHGARRSQDGGPPLINVISFWAGAADRNIKPFMSYL